MRLVVLLLVAAIPGLGGDWSPRAAAGYLDSREKAWFEWPVTKAPGGPCVSCHTNMTYLLARPALRRALGEAHPSTYENGLRDALRTRVDRNDGTKLLPAFSKEPHASEALGVEAIFAARFKSSIRSLVVAPNPGGSRERRLALVQPRSRSVGDHRLGVLRGDASGPGRE